MLRSLDRALTVLDALKRYKYTPESLRDLMSSLDLCRRMGEALEIPALLRTYRNSSTTPSEVISRLYPLLAQEEGMFITLASLEDLLDRCR